MLVLSLADTSKLFIPNVSASCLAADAGTRRLCSRSHLFPIIQPLLNIITRFHSNKLKKKTNFKYLPIIFLSFSKICLTLSYQNRM
jgi:hypothetical protein